MLKPKIPAAQIKEEVSPYRRPKEVSPDPGQYDNHLTPFGADLNTTASMGSKYKFKPKEGPAPGQYEVKEDLLKYRVPSALIREDVSP